MNRIRSVVHMHMKDRLGWFILPWVILGSSFVVNLGIAAYAEETITTGGLASIYIYMLVGGIVSLVQTYPFAVGFTMRRKDYVIGTLATMAGFSAYSAIVLMLLGAIEKETGWGVDLNFFHLGYLSEGNLLAQWWVHFGIMLNMLVGGFLISSIHRKFGKNGMFAFFIGISLILSVVIFLVSTNDGWDAIGRWLRDNPPTAAELSTYLFPLTVIFGFASHLLLRKAAV
ncbi:hypothetical protein [Cohnella panacarvi]|uniref:hypothetical protein n=1 Tax=Cohnella panacarvi TaxID=400776 RepID=UPI000478DB4E|nr:hypothetical protein [Cohnella panacarvi]